jgi:hypothetical protein
VITPPSMPGTAQFCKARAFRPLSGHAAAVDDFSNSTGTSRTASFATLAD